MKIKYFIIVLWGLMLVSCSRDNDITTEELKEEVVLRDFSLEKTHITIKKGEIGRIKILSGNGEYDYTSNEVAIINLSEDKEYIEIRGILESSRLTKITDIKSKKSIQVRIDIE